MLQIVRNHYVRSIETSLGRIPEGSDRKNIPTHLMTSGHVDEVEIVTWNRGTYSCNGPSHEEKYEYIDMGLTYDTPTHRQLTHIGFWTREGERDLGRLTFSQWNVVVLQSNVEKIEPPIRYEGSPGAISLRGLRTVAQTMWHGVELLEIAETGMPLVA